MIKLFYRDTYMTTFKARVTDCSVQADGLCRIVLDQTAFFPEEGGQAADKGTIDGQEVLDVLDKQGAK